MQTMSKILTAATLALVVGAITTTNTSDAKGATPEGPKSVAAPESKDQAAPASRPEAKALVKPAATPADFAGCPDGYVCFYDGPSWDNPIFFYYKYQCYALPISGYKRVFNNQTDGATVSFYAQGGCGDYYWTLDAGYYTDINLDGLPSISLDP